MSEARCKVKVESMGTFAHTEGTYYYVNTKLTGKMVGWFRSFGFEFQPA